MSNEFGYIDIILLAMIAGFIILRLRSILGRKTGHEDKIYQAFQTRNLRNLKRKKVDFKKSNIGDLEGKKELILLKVLKLHMKQSSRHLRKVIKKV